MVSVVKEENGFHVNEWQRIQLVSLKPYKLQSAYSQVSTVNIIAIMVLPMIEPVPQWADKEWVFD